ncbi:MAG: DUF1194 domain-containing protein [Inquilinus sp.]|nr:DUF1194 domain-containing protein [Inquilinus sp.]
MNVRHIHFARSAAKTDAERDGRLIFGCVYVALFMLAILIPAKVWGQERADACMAVGLDVSGSIHNEELRLQYDGLAAALIDQRFIRAVETGRHGLIAVAVYTWADSHDSVQIIVPWIGVQSGKDAQAIAETLQSLEVKHVVRSTSLMVALQAGTQILQGCPWFADRQLLNIAGDGYTNIGPSPLPARNAAIDRGIVINGLVVGEDPSTIEHYHNEVVGPTNVGFFVTVADYQAFARAMLNKFLLEISWNWTDWTELARQIR